MILKKAATVAEPWPTLWAHTDKSNIWVSNPMEKLPHQNAAPIVCMGDALHAMTPFSGIDHPQLILTWSTFHDHYIIFTLSLSLPLHYHCIIINLIPDCQQHLCTLFVTYQQVFSLHACIFITAQVFHDALVKYPIMPFSVLFASCFPTVGCLL